MTLRGFAVQVVAMVGLAAAIVPSAWAEVRLPKMISDHAVLQRDRPIHIWGWATPGAHLVAAFHGQSVAADAD